MTRPCAYVQLPERTDLMVVFAHPDDEIATFGAIIPYYLAAGKTVVAVCVTELEEPTMAAIRDGELHSSLWTCGMPYEPILLRLPDCGFVAPGKFESVEWVRKRWGGRAAARDRVIALYRRFRPVVVVTHQAETGEYGHPNHMASGWACIDAHDTMVQQGDVAAPQKLYVTSTQASGWAVDWQQPHSRWGGRSAAEIGTLALRCHQSQSCAEAGVRKELAYQTVRSQVGEDVERRDMFEHCR